MEHLQADVISTEELLLNFREIHILNVLRLLNKHCFKRKTLALKAQVEPKKVRLIMTAKGKIGDNEESLLRRICLVQGAYHVRVDRNRRLAAGMTHWIDEYTIDVLMPEINSAIDATKAMVIGDTDLFMVAAAQEQQLDKSENEDNFFAAQVQPNRTVH